MSKKINHLVVDTTAFIKSSNLQDIANNIYTVQEVIDEITNDKQKRKLIVLPYDLIVKDVFPENFKFVSDFSKKTGDYRSLSATDIKVMALTYQIEKEKVGTDHLKLEPTMQKTIKIAGLPGSNTSMCSESKLVKQETDSNIQDSCDELSKIEGEKDLDLDNTKESKLFEENEDDLLSDSLVKNMNLHHDEVIDNLLVKTEENEQSESEESEDDSDSDGGEWITPGNLATKIKEQDLGEFEDKCVEVACITSDFAMQNVLKQISLNVTSIDGRIIRQLRTFIFRCTACFKTTSVMTKLFCPKCGHATLKKVAISIDDDGNQHIHINGRKPLTARGKRFSLPTPKGGQHFQYPILTEDQHIHKRFATKIARKKTNALGPDYLAGFSPFAEKDVNSKSAVLGVRADKHDIKYWMSHYSKGKKK